MPSMRERGGVDVDVAPAPTATLTSTRTRTRTPAASLRKPKELAGNEDVELADELSRVLKISQPRVPPVSRRTAASSSSAAPPPAKLSVKSALPPVRAARTVTKASSSANLRAGPSTSKEAPPQASAMNTPAPRSRTAASSRPAETALAGPSRLSSTNPKPSEPRSALLPKPKALAPSRSSPDWATDPSLTTGQRAKAALSATNIALLELGKGLRAGYRLGREVEAEGVKWSARRMKGLVSDARYSIGVLREMDRRGDLGKNGIEVEKAAMGLVQRCFGISMYDMTMEILVESRASLLRLYVHDETGSSPHQTPTEPGSLKGIPEAWRRLLLLPRPSPSEQTGEVVRTILFQATITAWTCIIALKSKYSTRLNQILPIPRAPPSIASELNPFDIALTLPPSITSPLLNVFVRLTSNITATSADWPTATRLSFIAKALLSSSPSTTNDARLSDVNEIWGILHRKIYERLQEASADVKVMTMTSGILLDVLVWVEGLVQVRQEDKKAWFAGKAYMDLMDLWISIGRKLGESSIIDDALSRMTGSSSIVGFPTSGVAGPSTPRSSTPPSELTRPIPARSGSSRRAIQRISNAEQAVLRYCGELSSVAVLLDRVVDSPHDDIAAAAAQSALTNSPLLVLSDALISLTDSESGIAAFEKAGRRLEVVRRGCETIINKAGAGAQGLGAAVHVWMIGEIDIVEDFVQSSPLDLISVDASLTPLAAGAIGSLIALFLQAITDSSSTPQTPLVYLNRIHRLTILCRPFITASMYVDWIRCSTQNAHRYALTCYKAGKFAHALPYARSAVDRVQELVDYLKVEEMGKEERKSCRVDGVLECLSARWETVGHCAYKLQDYQVMLEANTAALTSISQVAVNKLSTLSNTTQYTALWESVPHLDALIRRLAAPILNLPSCTSRMVDHLLSMTFRPLGQEGEVVKALIWEKWFEVLEKGLHLPEIVLGSMRIAEVVLLGFKAGSVPVKRMRFISRVLGAMLQTGAQAENAPGLLDELETLCQTQDLSLDADLQSSISEYRATALILRALFAHRLGDAKTSTTEVSAIAARAMDELRLIIIPPSTSAPVKHAPKSPAPAPLTQGRTTRAKQPLGRATTTPALRATGSTSKARAVSETKTPKRSVLDIRKVSETTNRPNSPSTQTLRPTFTDLPRLLSLLTSLISLLGVLALPLQKIEGLKLARALIRSHEALSGEYVTLSARLGTEYARLGKWGRATAVFAQAKRCTGSGLGVGDDERKAEWGLRWAAVLAQMGKVDDAEYEVAFALHRGLQSSTSKFKAGVQVLERAGRYERAALARIAYATILVAEHKSPLVLPHLAASYRLYTRYVEFIAGLGAELSTPNGTDHQTKKVEEDDPFGAPSSSKIVNVTGADQPSKDSIADKHPSLGLLDSRLLSGIQWHATEAFLGSVFDLASAYSLKGKASDVEYFLVQAKQIAELVKSPLVVARCEARLAELEGRLRKYESSTGRLEVASAIFNQSDGPDAVESRIIHGDLLEKQEAARAALDVFKRGGEDIEGLEVGFGKKEALLPTPERPANISVKTISSIAHKDRLLPSTLGHVLRQRLWLGRDDGLDEVEKAELVRQIQVLGSSNSDKAEEMYLNGRLALLEVLKVFKTDLFMSSLTDSNRHSTRRTVNTLLARSSAAFHSALELMEQDGRVEDIRQAGMSLALLHAFQTSLGEGGDGLAAAAADLLASMSSITIRRELVDVISAKFVDGPLDDLAWPSFGDTPDPRHSPDTDSEDNREQALRQTWTSISTRLQSPCISTSIPIDLSPIPANWAVVSISVASDHSTMFLSRHQRDHHPLVLCLPLDRQGKREGEDNPLPFQLAVDELKDIVETSDQQARAAKGIITPVKRQEWWEARHALDARLGELVSGMEENWLGAFKSIFKPQDLITPKKIQSLRSKLEKIFNEALAGIGTDMRRVKTVRLDDAILGCFATLDGTTREEEVEDLVYFVLDFYGFHGIPVAIAELDIDQIGVDVKQALHEITISTPPTSSTQQPEHLLLVLDKNVQSFPWESIPVLRGRPVSRIPSLPFLLDHLQLSRITAPEKDGLLSVNARKVFYLLNPSGDLARTQTHFEPWLDQMKARAGWKGIVGRPPTDLELGNALRDCDLVLYFGHGGAEQYIRSKRVRNLPKCATTFLWGCSSGLLKDQGDLDRAGTALNYLMGGCPSLIANLWDVTDRDIDRLSAEVHKKLGLDASHIGHSLVPAMKPNGRTTTVSSEAALLPLSGMSTVQALNASRNECRLKYLTGAAPVVYGLPVWMF